MTIRTRHGALGLCAPVLVIWSGLSATAPTTPTTVPDGSAGSVETATMVTYLEALDEVDASPALAVASPRSAAWRYAEHQVAFEVAFRESGTPPSADVISPRGDGRFQSCPAPTTPFCAVFGDFTADSNGRISAFTVDGIDITPRLGDPSDAVTVGPVTARVRSSYRSARSDVLIIVLEIAVKAELSFASVARYTDRSGQTVEQTDAVVPKAFSAAAASTIALIFPAADPGGRLTLELAPVPGGTSTVVDLEVPALLGGAELAVSPGTPAPAVPTVTGVASGVIDSLGSALGAPLGLTSGRLPGLDVACFESAVELLPPSTRETVNQLLDDPNLFHTMNNELARVIAFAYVGCVDQETLIGFLAAVTSRAVEHLTCLTDAWETIITREAVASSLAYGHGLDDLPEMVVDQMTLTTAACVPDREWWIDSEAAVLEEYGWDRGQASCITTAVVDTLGVTPIIRRRVLTLPFYPVARAELERVDFIGRCNIQLGQRTQLGIPGTCLTGFGTGTENTEQIGCEESHNAEVVSVIDLDAEFSTWPGAQVLRETGDHRCVAAVEALPGDTSGYAAGWDIPLRLQWEQSGRVLTCALTHFDFSYWTGPSGLVP